MFEIGIVCLAVGVVAVALGIGSLFEDAFVKLYDKFDAMMENLLDKVLGA